MGGRQQNNLCLALRVRHCRVDEFVLLKGALPCSMLNWMPEIRSCSLIGLRGYCIQHKYDIYGIYMPSMAYVEYMEYMAGEESQFTDFF